ncbi:MAG: response regulator [Prevotellaceae bacterium]|jgi:signal transduction histidine kinase/ligand-binding sensor domain-containing protein/DNA-binding response OmpR family regulator|nr:response regulator [Prevotellaceae bacterium]
MQKNILLLPIFCISFAVSANDRYSVVNLTNNDGLSNSSINTMLQDSSGVMWFGTWDGLNMYNGREFKVYKPDVNNPFAISNNIIRDIVEENSHTLWIATDRGVDRLNRKNGKFEHFFANDGTQSSVVERSFLLAKSSANRIFAQIYGQGIFYFSSSSRRFVRLYEQDKLQAEKIFFDLDDNLWIHTTDKRLYKVVLDKSSWDMPSVISVCGMNLSNTTPEAVFFDPAANEILMQDSSGNLTSYRIADGRLRHYPVAAAGNGALKAVLFFDTHQVWGTSNGLYYYDIEKREVTRVLPAIQLLSLCKGTQQIIWVGTDMQGIYMLSQPRSTFYAYTAGSALGFGKDAVRCFLENDRNELWVGTKGGGIFIFDKTSSASIRCKQRITTSEGLINSSVFTIAQGQGGEYWIGTDGYGLNYFDVKANQLSALSISQEQRRGINLSSVYAILPTDSNTLWVGTSGYGMYKLCINRRTQPLSVQSYKRYMFDGGRHGSLSSNIVYAIVADDSAYLWIGTRGGGLNRFNTQTETFQAYRFSSSQPQSISSDDILCLKKDAAGALWIGTSMGLNKLERFDGDIPVFTRFTEKEGIPNNTIHGILEDVEHSLWVSTNRGVARLLLKEQRYRIISYFQKDGLQNNEFSDGAYYKSPFSSDLYFGGISGFNVFDPPAVADNSYMPPMILDAFYIQNVETHLYDYIKTRGHKETLLLKSSYKPVSFKFVSLDYLSGVKCEIAYRLENYDKGWIQLGTSSAIVLSNVPPGSYTLRVRGSNSDKIWSETCFSLPVTILPPWWASIWAYMGYAALCIGLIVLIRKQLKYRMAIKNSIKAKEFERQKTEEIHQAKLRFFTNIAHEFSNSLTLIYAPCEQLMQMIGSGDATRKHLNTIRTNSQRMQSLIQQLIEFRKAETGFLTLSIEPVDILELIRFVIDHFIEILEQRKITLRCCFPSQPLTWNTDRDGFEKLAFNLISNAVKYTPREEMLTIKVEEKNGNLLFEITNTGVGIQNADRKAIFDRFKVLEHFEMQISERFETRSGIGLALCKSIVEMLSGTIEVLSDGETYTTFVVTLPQKSVEQHPARQSIALPLAPPPVGVEERTMPNSDERQGEKAQKNGLILVIDDDKEIRALLHGILSKNFEVVEASDGKEGLEILKNRTPAIVVCDVIMPNMNGVEFVQVMKSQEQARHIPVILLSSKGSIESQIEGIETGADAYLPKPFHPRHLKALVESLTHRNKAVTDYSKSHYAGLEQFQGKLIRKEDKDLLTRISLIVKKNIAEESLSLEYVASETAISKMQLYRKIKELTDQTPTEFIRAIRLEHAERLLKTTNKTVQEIMYCCGFNNKAYFYREFSKKYQLTPKEYRNKAVSVKSS